MQTCWRWALLAVLAEVRIAQAAPEQLSTCMHCFSSARHWRKHELPANNSFYGLQPRVVKTYGGGCNQPHYVFKALQTHQASGAAAVSAMQAHADLAQQAPPSQKATLAHTSLLTIMPLLLLFAC